jgi:HAMP domain-containing protein
VFRNAPIRSKLIITLIGPLLLLSVLSLAGIRSNLTASARAGRVHDRAQLASSLSPLVHALQGERSLSASYVFSSRRAGRRELLAQRELADQAVGSYRTAAARIDARDGNQGLAVRLGYGLSELRRLPEQRQAIDSRPITADDRRVEPGIELAEEEGEERLPDATARGHGPIGTTGKALEQYTDTINDLLDVNAEIAPGAGDERLLQALASSVALSRAKDFAALQQGLLYDVFTAGTFAEGQYGRLSALRAAETVYTAQFENSATPEERQFYERTVAGADVDRVEHLQELAVDGEHARLDADAAAWFRAMGAKLGRLRRVERRLSADIAGSSLAVKASADRRALAYSVLLGAALLVAVLLSLVTARSLIRPLGRLKTAADEVAERTLPGVVRRLQAGEKVDLEAESAAPIASRSRDEIGQLARAFNDVHRVAVQVAGKEAALRRSVGDMFLNLARRSQSLIDRQLELIEGLRRARPGADLVEGLGELDHLATRMRRNAENLIVLSGAESARRVRGPVSLVELIGAAVGEINEHTRVEVLPLDDLRVAGHVASDVAHLLAELIENAVAFSAPGTRALVGGQALPSGYLLEVEDQGIGMTDEQLVKVNRDLANPPSIDFGLARMLGFFVVRQLASRHGIKVQLRHSWYGGITALVLLPRGLLELPPDLAAGESGLAAATAGLLERAGLGPDWFDHRVPMVHFPLRGQPALGPPAQEPG